MKLLIAILTLILVPKDCNNIASNLTALQERQDTITITYEAVSRGYLEEISVSQNALRLCNDINRKDYKTFECTKEDWDACLELLSEIDLDGLKALEAPTSMRHVDGAAHASLIIKDGDKEIRSNEFDHGRPPQEIKELVEKLLTLKKTASKQ